MRLPYETFFGKNIYIWICITLENTFHCNHIIRIFLVCAILKILEAPWRDYDNMMVNAERGSGEIYFVQYSTKWENYKSHSSRIRNTCTKFHRPLISESSSTSSLQVLQRKKERKKRKKEKKIVWEEWFYRSTLRRT